MPRLIFSGSSAPAKRDVSWAIETARVGMPVEFLCATSGSSAAMNSSGAMIRNGRGPVAPRNGSWTTLLRVVGAAGTGGEAGAIAVAGAGAQVPLACGTSPGGQAYARALARTCGVTQR